VNAVQPDAVRLAPPLILSAAEADAFLAALPAILDDAAGQAALAAAGPAAGSLGVPQGPAGAA
jgi:acetylornithine aminotransferase